jgi:formylglycine-generating enzyme required for sulfatase activity
VSLTPDHLQRLARVAHAPRDMGFVDLVGLAELDPATAFRDAILRGNMRGQDLSGFDFTGAEFRGCDLTGADLSRTLGLTPEMLATAITDDTTILPRVYFWACGKAPSWARDWGHDDDGPWVTFCVPDTEATQRMRWCPPGRYMMGAANGDDIFTVERPQHWVVLEQGFWMFDTACTEALWSAVMGRPPENPRGPAYPFTEVSWDDAKEFVQRLNDSLPGLAIDLPSEARWEYACRASTETPYHFGKCANPALANYASQGPVEVRHLPANPWGLFEMHGNVWEWCLDHWHDTYSGAPEDGSAWIDREDATLRVLRGGSWDAVSRRVRAAYRRAHGQAERLGLPDGQNTLGFRCVRVGSEGPSA